MKMTNGWLKEIGACRDGVEWFNNQKETDGTKVIKKLIEEDRIDWANWTICRVFSKKQKIQYAVYAAEQVIDIFEKKYPDDKRPRKAIEAAKKCIENDTEENRSAAESAAESAAWGARSAASAWGARRKKMQLKILKYGISLLKT